MARPCPIHFIGVWDTVSSVGLRNILLHISGFPFTYKNPEVTHVRHAVSIDERRAFFRQNLMGRWAPGQDVVNVWFAGVHSDVGGGYAPCECALSKITFEWMMREAQACGFKVNMGAAAGDYPYELAHGQPPDPCGKLHDSLTGGWLLAEVIPTRHFSIVDEKYHWTMNLASPRNIAVSAKVPGVGIHESVLVRMNKIPEYRPRNLPGSSAEVRLNYTIVS